MKSEHVVRVVDADVAHEIDDVPFLVMELLAGRDFERICVEGQPSSTEVIGWMRQLAAALDKAHGEGVVHRDLKPENLFLAEREGLPPIVKILDFGVAKMASEADGHATATGQILGTPRYMAPEQATDAKQISAAADRFALGLITFRMLCGRHYFSGDNLVVLLRNVGRGPREKPSALGSKLGPAFDAWFARACALAPRERFATCAEQVDALAQAIAIEPARGRGRARAWVAALGAGGLAVAAWAAVHRAAPDVTPAETPRAPSVSAIAPPAAAPPATTTAAPATTTLSPRAAAPTLTAEAAPSIDSPRRQGAARSSKRRELPSTADKVNGQGAATGSTRAPDPTWDEP